MGSDGKMKNQTRAWLNIKNAILLTTSLMAVLLFSRGLSAPRSNQAVASESEQREAVPRRPGHDSPEYDQYFRQQALTFTLSNEFDIMRTLRRQGFRGTRKWVITMQQEALQGSKVDALLKTHIEWTKADWRSLQLSTLPVLFNSTLLTSTRSPISSEDAGKLKRQLDGVSDHTFYFEMASVVPDTKMVLPSSEKIIFSYSNHTWEKDRLSSSKFLSLLELFTNRQLHGAHIKEFLNHQTGTQPMMQEEGQTAKHPVQSLVMMPRLTAPRAIQEKCLALARDNITENLDSPIELKVLVVWGKAYMGVCFSPICNPFLGDTNWRDLDGPRYTMFPDGKSMFRMSEMFSPAMQSCASAVDEFVLRYAGSAMAAAERVAATLGAPWLRVDFLLDETAPKGILLHQVRTISSSVAGWTQRSERVMQILARGFEERSRAQQGTLPRNMAPEEPLKRLSCHVKSNGLDNIVSCGAEATKLENSAVEILPEGSAVQVMVSTSP